ncbi:hypothetical protein [Agromyces sp. Leaf222]|uniref:hypothetical protein n=1 Tax=Agromyces sp. Leaf222 TaxID=1735688 RepID=UPI000AD746D8|nr:hypothetical protein [Agromyces sp. Leaf222]
MKTVSPFTWRVGLGVMASLIMPFAHQAVAPNSAIAAEDPAVSWSVAPAGADGPDDRAWVEQSLDPGETRTEHLAVRNLGESEVTFALSAADGYFTDTGRFNMLHATTPSTSAGLWIDLPESVTVPASGTVVVPYTVTVPERAVPGDYAAGVAASITSVGSGDGATIGIESRVGFRVLTRVVGELQPALAIVDASSEYRVAWNPFLPGLLSASFTLENTGNTRLAVTGQVAAAGGASAFTASDEVIELLPGERREVKVELDDVWPLVLVPTSVETTVQVADASGGWRSAPDAAESATLSTWAPPWPQLTVLLALALITAALVARRRRDRRAVADLVERAREEGRREAWTEAPPSTRADSDEGAGVAVVSPTGRATGVKS